MKHLILFENFLFEDGFGKNYFYPEKREKAIYYYFKISDEDEQKGFILKISKNCVLATPEGSENSYACLRIEPISIATMDDHLANETDFKFREEDMIEISEGEFPRIYMIISEAIGDYIQKNPKVTTIYDEMLLNIPMDSEEYKNDIESMMTEWSYGKWSVQRGSEEKILIYQKRNHK
jgi:hypothetical protein